MVSAPLYTCTHCDSGFQLIGVMQSSYLEDSVVHCLSQAHRELHLLVGLVLVVRGERIPRINSHNPSHDAGGVLADANGVGGVL